MLQKDFQQALDKLVPPPELIEKAVAKCAVSRPVRVFPKRLVLAAAAAALALTVTLGGWNQAQRIFENKSREQQELAASPSAVDAVADTDSRYALEPLPPGYPMPDTGLNKTVVSAAGYLAVWVDYNRYQPGSGQGGLFFTPMAKVAEQSYLFDITCSWGAISSMARSPAGGSADGKGAAEPAAVPQGQTVEPVPPDMVRGSLTASGSGGGSVSSIAGNTTAASDSNTAVASTGMSSPAYSPEIRLRVNGQDVDYSAGPLCWTPSEGAPSPVKVTIVCQDASGGTVDTVTFQIVFSDGAYSVQ